LSNLAHRLDLLAHPLEARGEDRAVSSISSWFQAADAEQEAAARHLVERSGELRGLDRVALDHQQTPVPIFSVVVAAAAAVRITNGSIAS